MPEICSFNFLIFLILVVMAHTPEPLFIKMAKFSENGSFPIAHLEFWSLTLQEKSTPLE